MSKGTSVLRLFFRFLAAGLVCLPLAGVSWAAHIANSTSAKTKSQQKISETQRTRRRLHHLARAHRAAVTTVSATPHHRRYRERFSMSSFADDIASGDV